MRLVKRAISSVLLACGIVLVFLGLSAALGFSPAAMVASVAAIAALLYAGGTWFGGAPAQLTTAGAERVIVFDRLLQIVSGAAPGEALLSQFPAPLRPELEVRCRMALRGEHTHFSCEHAGVRVVFDISPVQTVDETVVYGVVISGQGMPIPAATTAPATTVA
jgi:hypothetical protein